MTSTSAVYNWFRSHPRRVDFGIMAAFYLVFALTALAMEHPIASFILCSLLIIPLAFRRSHTIAATAVVAGTCLIAWAVGTQPLPGLVAVPMLVYACAAYAPRWASFTSLGLAGVGAVLAITRFWYFTGPTGIANLPIGAVYVLLIWAVILVFWTFGDLTRTRRLQLQSLQDRARRLEVEQQQERDLAAADERSHIAREMHDIVAHSLSVIITQADGGRYAGVTDPAIAGQTLETIAETGRASLREMRRLLGVLRGEDEVSTRPLPSLADVDELLLSVRAAGLDVSYAEAGSPRRGLPAGAELTAYRVVQEALTNVLKHAGPQSSAAVELSWQLRGLALLIADDGRGAAADPATAGAGQGIRGMGERAKLYDGTLNAGPRPGGGFQVSAFIPYSES